MGYAVIYTMALIILLAICIIKKRSLLAIFLVSYYLFISVVSIIAGTKGVIDLSKTSGYPYLLLLVAYILYFQPFFTNRKTITFSKVDYKYINKFRPFCWIYIICSIICIWSYLAPLSKLIQSGNWAMARYMHYMKGNETVYTNVVEKYCILFSLYFFLIAVIVSLLMIREYRDSKLGIILMVFAIVSNFMQALYVVGRGTIYNDLLIVVLMYLFIFRDINKKRNLQVMIMFLLMLIVIIPFMSVITESRFSSNSTNEMLRYFGEAPVVFNVNVASINIPAFGKFLFSGVCDTGFSQSKIGGTWGTSFYTFIGAIFIDWGSVGVLILGMFWGCFVFYNVVSKSCYKISDLYIIFYYYFYLLRGALVIGNSFFLEAVITAITYVFIRCVIEKTSIKKINVLKTRVNHSLTDNEERF